jgi:hypothetical protein
MKNYHFVINVEKHDKLTYIYLCCKFSSGVLIQIGEYYNYQVHIEDLEYFEDQYPDHYNLLSNDILKQAKKFFVKLFHEGELE